MTPLNILHVLRTPVGGLFRHVLDLARGQSARGHRIGIVADSETGGPQAERALRELAPMLALGVSRTPMPRQPGPRDLAALLHVMRRITATRADVVHGHGAKGGTYARLALNTRRAARVYTPHGGSLHYDARSLAGRLFLGTERLLMSRGNLYIFESAYSAGIFAGKVGKPPGLARVVHNGLAPTEFEPVAPAADATDLLFVGELRLLKGVDLLIDAVGLLHAAGRPVTATIVGDGPDRSRFVSQVERLGLTHAIRFPGALPARQAFGLGRILLVPSRAESLPYIVLECAAAGKPLLASRVGGIPEIFGPIPVGLVPPDDAPALAQGIAQMLGSEETTRAATAALRERVAEHFSVDHMVDHVLAAYAEVLVGRVPNTRDRGIIRSSISLS
jgi:glycosyltransferase involved in cell wall biosynthesis